MSAISLKFMKIFKNLPKGMPQSRQHAEMAPADEPQILFSKKYGA